MWTVRCRGVMTRDSQPCRDMNGGALDHRAAGACLPQPVASKQRVLRLHGDGAVQECGLLEPGIRMSSFAQCVQWQ
jgi:hypothetical protein